MYIPYIYIWYECIYIYNKCVYTLEWMCNTAREIEAATQPLRVQSYIIYIFKYIYIYVYTYVYVYTYIYTYVYMYVYNPQDIIECVEWHN